MDKLSLICDFIIAICGVIPTIITTFLLVKNIIKEKDWKVVEKIAMSAMTSVEDYASQHPEMTSTEKLDMAILGVKAGLAAAGIKIDEDLIKKIIAYIEEMCSWSKTVNCECE